MASIELTPERRAFGRGLTLVAEHTWGVDIKTYLRDETAWDRPALRGGAPERLPLCFYRSSHGQSSEAISTTALEALEPTDRTIANAALAELTPAPPAEPQPGATLRDNGWTAALDPTTGDITRLITPDGTTIEGAAGSLLGYRHESYNWTELQRHLDSYLQHRAEWAILDHGKPGLERRAPHARRPSCLPTAVSVRMVGRASREMPADAQQRARRAAATRVVDPRPRRRPGPR